MELIKKLAKKHRNLLLYGLLGSIGALTDFIVYVIIIHIFPIQPVIASTISTTFGIVASFILNSRYNFKKTDYLWHRFAAFFFVGCFGMILSAVLLFVLFNVMGLNPTFAKLLTIPPVVLAQFFLNKHVSFSEDPRRFWKNVFTWTKKYRWLIALNVVYMLLVGYFMSAIPSAIANTYADPSILTKQAPDEVTHYKFNTEFILENGRLPISGKDDIEALSSCRDNDFGQVPCVYSYNVYPALPYIISAIGAKAAPSLDIHPAIGARLPGLIYALIFLNCAFLIALLITKSRPISIVLATSISFIPQVIFTFAYLNLDGFSMAVAGIVGLAFTRYLLKPSLGATIFLGASIGLLSTVKYNFFVLLLPMALVILFQAKQKKEHLRNLPKLILWSIIGFLVIGSFWYIRNLVLYHDLTGQTFVLNEMAKYHALGTAHALNANSLSLLWQMHFWPILFRSFIATFGSMVYLFESAFYQYILIALCVLSGITVYQIVVSQKRKQLLLALATLVLTGIAVVGMVVYNSLKYDFQPQGRYLFPILVPVLMYVGYHYRTIGKKGALIPWILFGIVLFSFILGFELFTRVYR